MKKLFLLCICVLLCREAIGFDKVVIWGHKLHSHTHSYIHNAFFRAFQELGYPVYWFDDRDFVEDFDFSDALFITEGQVDKRIPLREDCEYILHNCDQEKYRSLLDAHQAIVLQVYTDDVLSRDTCDKKAPCIYYDRQNLVVYMPWGTDLLPREIDEVKNTLLNVQKQQAIHWVGTVGGGVFGNANQLSLFANAAKTRKIDFKIHTKLPITDNVRFITASYMAPAIVGEWQKKAGYIPCRIFKNISYGQMGITNSLRVYELFEQKIVYNADEYQLFFDAEEKIQQLQLEELYGLMDFVRDNHTYINRIQTLLDFFNEVKHFYKQEE